MMRLLLVLAAAAPLFAQCTYSTSPDASQPISVPAGGSPAATIAITTRSDCPWSYYTDSPSWITGPTGTPSDQAFGSGSFTWSAGVNTVSSPKAAKIYVVTVNGAITFSITQAAQVCTLTLPVASASAVVGGATASFQLQTNCLWAAASNASWITLPSGSTGTLDGSVSYTVAANVCLEPRSSSIVVQSGSISGPTQQFQINQDGSVANLTLSPSTLTVPVAGADGRFSVVTGSSCPWSASSDVSWIQFQGSSSSTGSGGVSYHILANTGPQRTGGIHVGTQVLPVTQQGAAAPAPVVTKITNGASYATGAVAPGEIVALFGTGMGPATGVGQTTNSDGSYPKTLAGVTVTFDGVAAPLTYASATQINAVVPYSVAGGASTQVTVQYQGTASTGVTLPVQSAAPGIFTFDRSGLGAGAILNQDYSFNSVAKPAARGTTVMIYCTGGGVTSPASADGALSAGAEPLPRLITQPVSVTIGGVAAQVSYSGGAPLQIAGLVQINAQIPAGVTPGASVPILVKVGDWQSAPGVTLSVQ